MDDKEYRRRVELIASVSFVKRCGFPISISLSSLMRAEVALRSLADHFVDDTRNVTARDRQIVDDLTRDVRDAIHEYQVSSVDLLAVQFAEVLRSDSCHNRRTSTSKTLT